MSVVICAFTEARWNQLTDAVSSVHMQNPGALECIVVIDHNEALWKRAAGGLIGCRVVRNTYERGLSGARNTGAQCARGDIIAFIDDDARAQPGWLAALVMPYRQAGVVGTGGVALADWPEARPRWFPPEFDWVVGCSYRGLPEKPEIIRNPIGANMSFRRAVFGLVGGFGAGIGRIGAFPAGCEETEFSIRACSAIPGATIVFVPSSVVHHTVTADRTSARYFVRRCLAEGMSKSLVSKLVGAERSLASERRYVRHTLSKGVLTGIQVRRCRASLMIMGGFVVTAVGFVLTHLGLRSVVERSIDMLAR